MPSIDLVAACLLFVTGDSISMFDGSTLDNWTGNPEHWTVENGVIVGVNRADSPIEHSDYLYWDGIASDFVLELDIRVLGGNSGIQYRSEQKGAHDIEGYQADLDSDNQYTGALYESNGRGLMSLRGQKRGFLFQDNRRDLGIIAGVDEPPVLPHEWNRYRITADGPRITHHINDRLMTEVIDEDPERRRDDGRIAIQIHSGPPMRVEARNLSIRPLNGTSIEMKPLRKSPVHEEPEWIWCQPEPSSDETCRFSRTFEVPSTAVDSWIRVTCDNAFTAELDGRVIATGDEWWQPVQIDLPQGLARGTHVLKITGHNDHGPAGMMARLSWIDQDGDTHHVISDSSWKTGTEDLPIISFGKASEPNGPWPDTFTGTEERTHQGTNEIQIFPGFEIDTLLEAGPGQGSWVAMTFDDRGRLIISPQHGGLLRMTLPQSSDDEVEVEPIGLDVGSAQGLLHAHGALYAMVTKSGEDGGGIWRLRDTSGDDQYDSSEHLAKWGAGNEHGNHAMILGPDDLIYIVQGNHTPLPPRVDPDGSPPSPFQNWMEDDVSERLWDANGHAVGVMTPGGVILRTDPDISHFEVIAGGLRNAYDLAFNETGDLFTWDSDMEWDLGTPWYRPPRALHVVPGGEFGWRGGTAKWPDWYPDSLPTMLDMPEGSPTGMAFGGDGNFPEPWQSALFLADWTYGRLFVLHLEEAGASWRAEHEVFASGRPFNISDLAFGPDGHLYLITGGRGTQSVLYRIRSTGSNDGAAPSRSASSEALRAMRRDMEMLQITPDSDRLEEILEALRSDDRVLRYTARVALEQVPVDLWRDAALSEEHPHAAIEMLLGLSRMDTAQAPDQREDSGSDRIILRAIEIDQQSEHSEISRLAARVIALALVRQGTPDNPTVEAIQTWQQRIPRDDVPARRLMDHILVNLQSPDLPARLVEDMEEAGTQEAALHAALLLRLVEQDWTDDLRRRYILWLRAHQNLAGGRSINGFVRAIESDALARWDPQTKDGLLADLEAVESIRAGHVSRPRINNWTMDNVTPHLGDLSSNRNFVQGRLLYREARCLECHRFHGSGGSTGPDLTGIGARFTDHDLLESILQPSKVISDQYRSTMVIRTDDTIDTGRLLEDTDTRIVLNIDPYGYETLSIPRSEIAEVLPSPVSPMPTGHVNSLSLEELLDLMAYLNTAGDPSATPFRPTPLPKN